MFETNFGYALWRFHWIFLSFSLSVSTYLCLVLSLSLSFARLSVFFSVVSTYSLCAEYNKYTKFFFHLSFILSKIECIHCVYSYAKWALKFPNKMVFCVAIVAIRIFCHAFILTSGNERIYKTKKKSLKNYYSRL